MAARIGIDPGLHGAISMVWESKIELYDMPIMRIPWVVNSRYKNMVDVCKLKDILAIPAAIEQINIEQVNVRPGDGKASSWVFAGAFYSVISTVRLMGYKPRMVHPTRWKRKYGLINMPKDASRLAALQAYPHLLPLLKRKKDVDRAEALLIGAF